MTKGSSCVATLLFCFVLVFFTFFTLDTWLRQVFSHSETLPHSVFLKSNKYNTKRPSALLTMRVQRRASPLGIEIAAMLLLDHAEPEPVHPSTTNSPAVCDWLLAPIQRGDPVSPRMQHRQQPPLTQHTQTGVRQTHCLRQHSLFLASNNPRRPCLPPSTFENLKKETDWKILLIWCTQKQYQLH